MSRTTTGVAETANAKKSVERSADAGNMVKRPGAGDQLMRITTPKGLLYECGRCVHALHLLEEAIEIFAVDEEHIVINET